jgi:hypothetical protein
MTDAMMSLKGLIGKTSDADILREMISFAAERLMEMEVGALTGAAYGEKNPERRAQRNGYRDRGWETRVGTVELRIPKLAISMLSRAAADGGEGIDCRDPGGLHPAHLHPRPFVWTKSADQIMQKLRLLVAPSE